MNATFKRFEQRIESRTHILAELHSRTLRGRPPDLSILCLADAHGQLGQEILSFALVRSDNFLS
jgi:hypothetical protein